MKNLKLTIAYEGTNYLGWQKTKIGPSVEEELEKAASQIVQHPIQFQAASRTDAGVHAEGQVVNFLSKTPLSLSRLQKSMNGLLPKDIQVLHMEEMPLSFHPTLDAKGKEYQYHVCLGAAQLPFDRKFSWHFLKPVDVEKMRKAACYFIGEHDFSALTSDPQEDNRREIFHIEVEELGENRLKIRVSGNRFLYKMVRVIVGTLLYVGCGMLEIKEIPRHRKDAGMTAPAHGLTLKKVFYD